MSGHSAAPGTSCSPSCIHTLIRPCTRLSSLNRPVQLRPCLSTPRPVTSLRQYALAPDCVLPPTPTNCDSESARLCVSTFSCVPASLRQHVLAPARDVSPALQLRHCVPASLRLPEISRQLRPAVSPRPASRLLASARPSACQRYLARPSSCIPASARLLIRIVSLTHGLCLLSTISYRALITALYNMVLISDVSTHI